MRSFLLGPGAATTLPLAQVSQVRGRRARRSLAGGQHRGLSQAELTPVGGVGFPGTDPTVLSGENWHSSSSSRSVSIQHARKAGICYIKYNMKDGKQQL